MQAEHYLRALGVENATERALLSQRLESRLAARAALEDPDEAAIVELLSLLDDWLAAELSAVGAAPALVPAARAAVLAGAVPGWSTRWAGLSPAPLGAALQAVVLDAVPPPAPLVMEPSPILLCCHRLRTWFGQARARLFGRQAEVLP